MVGFDKMLIGFLFDFDARQTVRTGQTTVTANREDRTDDRQGTPKCFRFLIYSGFIILHILSDILGGFRGSSRNPLSALRELPASGELPVFFDSTRRGGSKKDRSPNQPGIFSTPRLGVEKIPVLELNRYFFDP